MLDGILVPVCISVCVVLHFEGLVEFFLGVRVVRLPGHQGREFWEVDVVRHGVVDFGKILLAVYVLQYIWV